MRYVPVRCIVILQCVMFQFQYDALYSMLCSIAMHLFQYDAMCSSTMHCVLLQCMCSSTLQCVPVRCNVLYTMQICCVICMCCRFELEVAEIMKSVREGGVVIVQKKPDDGPPVQVNSSNWEGLNSSLLYQKYPGRFYCP